jgi:hypothetical protein
MPRRKGRGGRRGTRGLSGFALSEALDSEQAGREREDEERRRRAGQSEETSSDRIENIGGTWYIKGKDCSSCDGTGECPVCQGSGKVGNSACPSCYDEPFVGRDNHLCNTCKGVRLEVANII